MIRFDIESCPSYRKIVVCGLDGYQIVNDILNQFMIAGFGIHLHVPESERWKYSEVKTESQLEVHVIGAFQSFENVGVQIFVTLWPERRILDMDGIDIFFFLEGSGTTKTFYKRTIHGLLRSAIPDYSKFESLFSEHTRNHDAFVVTEGDKLQYYKRPTIKKTTSKSMGNLGDANWSPTNLFFRRPTF